MTAKSAYSLISGKFKKLTATSCYEYDSVFVFNMVPRGHKITSYKDMPLDTLFSVDKKTGKISIFSPFDIPLEEYKRGKKVTNYKGV